MRPFLPLLLLVLLLDAPASAQSTAPAQRSDQGTPTDPTARLEAAASETSVDEEASLLLQRSTRGEVARFESLHDESEYSVLRARILGRLGGAGSFETIHSSNSDPTVNVVTAGEGPALRLSSTGTGTPLVVNRSGFGPLDHLATFQANGVAQAWIQRNGHGVFEGGLTARLGPDDFGTPLHAFTQHSSSQAAVFSILNPANDEHAVTAWTQGSGAALYALNTGTGVGLEVDHAGTSGDIARFEVNGGLRSRITRTGQGRFTGGLVAGSIVEPLTMLHVARSVDATATPANHVALLENTAFTNNVGPDVLALKTSAAAPTDNVNFITFLNGSNQGIGSVEGNATGDGLTFKSGSADFAEVIPQLDPAEVLAPGEVVGVFGGHITRRTDGAEHVAVVSARPIVLGNAPEDGQAPAGAPVALLGQVRVKVRGTVQAGDFVLASGREDGTAVARPAAEMAASDYGRVVGRAWEASEGAGVREVLVAVGLDRAGALATLVGRQQAALETLEATVRAQQAQLDALKAMVVALGARAE